MTAPPMWAWIADHFIAHACARHQRPRSPHRCTEANNRIQCTNKRSLSPRGNMSRQLSRRGFIGWDCDYRVIFAEALWIYTTSELERYTKMALRHRSLRFASIFFHFGLDMRCTHCFFTDELDDLRAKRK